MAQREAVTHFGYQQIRRDEKAPRVRAVFDSVAERYDLMNDLMSLGLHRVWKRIAITLCGSLRNAKVLDLAGGTGDLAGLLVKRVGPKGQVVMADINLAMLNVGRDRLLDRGIVDRLTYLAANAEQLPFADASFDCVTIGFGLRNVTDQPTALAEMRRVLRPGALVMVLEFSKPAELLRPLYDAYSFRVLPRLGQAVAGDADSYRYLAESIRRHPDQPRLLEMMRECGFEHCRYVNLSSGVVAIHIGYRI